MLLKRALTSVMLGACGQVITAPVRLAAATLLFCTRTLKSSGSVVVDITNRLEQEGTGVLVVVDVSVGVFVTVGVMVKVDVGVGVGAFVGVSVGLGVIVGVFDGVFEGTTKPPPPGLGLEAG
jgi:hypothetical protein